MASQSKIEFFDIPRELRDQIYGYIFESHSEATPRTVIYNELSPHKAIQHSQNHSIDNIDMNSFMSTIFPSIVKPAGISLTSRRAFIETIPLSMGWTPIRTTTDYASTLLFHWLHCFTLINAFKYIHTLDIGDCRACESNVRPPFWYALVHRCINLQYLRLILKVDDRELNKQCAIKWTVKFPEVLREELLLGYQLTARGREFLELFEKATESHMIDEVLRMASLKTLVFSEEYSSPRATMKFVIRRIDRKKAAEIDIMRIILEEFPEFELRSSLNYVWGEELGRIRSRM